jgi:formylglycine-generating enzyme required for sulfatase activity
MVVIKKTIYRWKMRISSLIRQQTMLVLMLVGTLILLAACSGGDTAATTVPATAEPSPPPTEVPVPTDLPMTATARVSELARSGVTRNQNWQPIQDEFDAVIMVLVPAGCFTMGTNAVGFANQGPAHEQCIETPFWIDKTEVTQSQFRIVAGEDTSTMADSALSLPVRDVTWFEADTHCKQRGGRLPTEVEWEYVARGPSNWRYPWSNRFEGANVVYGVTANGRPATVGSRPDGDSWVGAQDMLGNVEEWTASQWASYPYDAADGREADTGDQRNIRRVLRGGSFTSVELYATVRAMAFSERSARDIGFRCALPYFDS